MKLIDKEECSFPKWHNKFSSYTTKSVVIPLPHEVVAYLREDTLVLPEESTVSSSSLNEESDEWKSACEDTPALVQPSFPAFSEALKKAIQDLGGEVFIKLNWTAPTDAACIAKNKSVKCNTIEDIYLLLKSSDKLEEDLSYPFKGNSGNSDSSGYAIVLKQWQEINPGCEYRCFVVHRELIVISQRDCKVFYSHIPQNKFEILQDLSDFFKEKIRDKFPLSNYTFDVVRKGEQEVELVDFGPFEAIKKTALISWKELHNMLLATAEDTPASPEFRFLGEDIGIQPGPCAYGMPQEVVHLCAQQSRLSLMEYVQMGSQSQYEDISSDEEA